MQKASSSPPKPVSEIWRPELVRLPRLTRGRRAFRAFAVRVMRLITALFLKAEVRGLENFPRRGPALVTVNHLGDADAAVLLAFLPRSLEVLGKIELYDFPLLGKLMEAYGVIWLHRGTADRRALRAALQALSEGRTLVIAPEGRYSLIGGLEAGASGAAFLALQSGAAVVPVALTGTDNPSAYGHLRRLRRAPVTLTVGKPFQLADQVEGREAIRAGTRQIMEALASLLPPEKRGLYADSNENL